MTEDLRSGQLNANVHEHGSWGYVLERPTPTQQQRANRAKLKESEKAIARLQKLVEKGGPGRVEMWLRLRTGKKTERVGSWRITQPEYDQMKKGQRRTPQRLGRSGDLTYFWFQGKFFATEEKLTAEDVLALVTEKENRKRLRLEKAHSLRRSGGGAERDPDEPAEEHAPMPPVAKLRGRRVRGRSRV